MFSKYGRIYGIDLSVSQALGKWWAHVSVFRCQDPEHVTTSNTDLSSSLTGQMSRATIGRLRRAQDKLMEGKHE